MRPHRSNPGEIVFLLVATVISFSFFQLSHLEGGGSTATALEGARLAQEQDRSERFDVYELGWDERERDQGGEDNPDRQEVEKSAHATSSRDVQREGTAEREDAIDVYELGREPDESNESNERAGATDLPAEPVEQADPSPVERSPETESRPSSVVRTIEQRTLARARDRALSEDGRLGAFLRQERVGSLTQRDTDGDGLTDFDEVVLFRTDPTTPRTAGGEATDGELVRALRDPRDPARVVTPEDPRLSRAEVFDELTLDAATVVTVGESTEQVNLSGTALPHTVVTLYLYSDPTVVRVQADAEGRWQHTLQAPLPEGEHTAYLALTDADGTIHAQSAPMPLVKDAGGITFVASAADDIALARSRGVVASTYPTLIALLTLLAFVVALLLLGARGRDPADPDAHG
ncbi:hypothetical protein GVX82_01700 [Patescibacteria group bacterium]|jgi:hypothetical protein|nr:hypothetical protein [Patescibacteria group bacterium]